jgi:hypothetical protein
LFVDTHTHTHSQHINNNYYAIINTFFVYFEDEQKKNREFCVQIEINEKKR